MTSSGPRSPARRTTPRKPLGSTRSGKGITPPRVGAHIQQLRNERKMTLEDLSRAAGVSKSMLSDIERDKANPTIAMAWRLTHALGVNLDRLFASASHDADPIQVAGPHDIPTLSGTDAKYQLRVWGPIELAGRFEWYELTLQPAGALVSGAHEPHTHEHLTVLHGTIELVSGASRRKLKAGETARYPADRPHTIRNAGKGKASALLVVVHP